MKNYALPLLVLCILSIQNHVVAHCEVPCGIYADQLRFQKMLEDQKTIEKAQSQIVALAGQKDPQSANQLARWVATKEDHATKIQHTIAQYFMTQRLKPSSENYVPKLTAAHAVMISAMKCKQSTAAETSTALRDTILKFYKAYEGK